MNKQTISFLICLFTTAITCAQTMIVSEIYFVDDERSVGVSDGKIVDFYLYDILMANHTKSVFVSIQCDTSSESFSSNRIYLHFKSNSDTLWLRPTCPPQQRDGKVIQRLMAGLPYHTLPFSEQFYRRNVLKGWGEQRQIGRFFSHNSLHDCAQIRRKLQQNMELFYEHDNFLVPIPIRNVPIQMMIQTTQEEKEQIKTLYCY